MKKLPINEKFELVTINPGYVYGPAIHDLPFEISDQIEDYLFNR